VLRPYEWIFSIDAFADVETPVKGSDDSKEDTRVSRVQIPPGSYHRFFKKSGGTKGADASILKHHFLETGCE
jgi:hypothetical protein